MTVDKKHAFVKNKYGDRTMARFFAMIHSLGLDTETQKNYWKGTLGVQHMKDITNDQWSYVFAELEQQLKEKAEDDGAIFAEGIEEALKILDEEN
jgi:hypothetical protein